MAQLLYIWSNGDKGDALCDFGLTDPQGMQLRNEGVTIWSAQPGGHIADIEYRDISANLATGFDIDQVAFADCSDIVFLNRVRRAAKAGPTER